MIFDGGSDDGDNEPSPEMVQERQIERQVLDAAQEQATKEITENANLLRELRRAGIGTEKYDWVEQAVGPDISSSHAIGNRSSEYEQQVKWGSLGKGMQHVAERSPGRLCRGERLALAQGTHGRAEKDVEEPLTTDERRALRAAYDAVANFKSLSASARGLKTIGETTVTARREVNEENRSLTERAGGLLD